MKKVERRGCEKEDRGGLGLSGLVKSLKFGGDGLLE